MTRVREGVVRYEAVHERRPLRLADVHERVEVLLAWREVLRRLGLVGQDPARYDGAGFGNLSVRVGPPNAPRHRRPFLVTGTQTGGLEALEPEHFALVRRWDPAQNRVWSEGEALPSSEALTHGAVYDLNPRIRAVFHVHDRNVWQAAGALGLPSTHPNVEYGTPEMAYEVERLYRHTALPVVGVFVMGGHEDGVVSFGSTPGEAGLRLVHVLVAALARARPRIDEARVVGSVAWVRGVGGD